MTQEEKLSKFYDVSLESAKQERERILEDYRMNLKAEYEAHVSEKKAAAAERVKAETASLRREHRRELTDRQNRIRRKIAGRQEEVKEEIFANAAGKIESFRKTPEYHTWLFRKVKAAKRFAGEDEIRIFVDPSDSTYMDEIEAVSGIRPTVSEEPFGGGIRALIPGRKILIDNSFDTLIAEERENFKFDGGNLNG